MPAADRDFAEGGLNFGQVQLHKFVVLSVMLPTKVILHAVKELIPGAAVDGEPDADISTAFIEQAFTMGTLVIVVITDGFYLLVSG